MAKKLTSTKAKKILHDKEVHGHPLTEQQRKFFGAIAGGAKPYQDGGWLDKYDAPQAQNGIEGTMGGLTDVGFNYNGAWGGTMQDGGMLQPPMAGAVQTVPMAQLGDSVKPIPMQLAMGGSLPGSVGFMYARTQSPAPSNGPYAKKTKASAQNGQEMKFYQEGLDFTPKTISQDGSEIPVDPMGYWNPENVGSPVTIPSNIITMEGVDQPLLGISDTGDVQYMEPGEDYEFDGEYVTEYPVAQGGTRVPITVSNPKDPRLKNYQDSLRLYKQSKEALDPKYYEKGKGAMAYFLKDKSKTQEFIKKYGILRTKENPPKGIEPVAYENWAEGLDIPVYKKPTQPVEYRVPQRDTLYVSNPNDPRLKSYQDSLSAYNDMRKYFDMRSGYPRFKNEHAYYQNRYDTPVFHTISDEVDFYKKRGWKNFGPEYYLKRTFGSSNTILPEKIVNWVPREGVERARKDLDLYNQIGLGIPVYKKPVQPIAYRPEPEYKPRPRIEAELPRTQTKDLSYDMPTPVAQPSKTKKIVTRKDEPERTKKTPVKDFLEDMRLRMEDRKMERKTKKGIKSQLKCWAGVCRDEDGNIVAKDGVSVNMADQYPIEKLDQSLNFTNYNKPTKGGWLDKYN